MLPLSGDSLKLRLSLTALGLALSLGTGHAADSAAPTAQQSPRANCNTDAKDMKGDARKAFISPCLKQ